MNIFNKMKDMEFAKQIFKAWDVKHKGYLTAKEFSEQLCGLGLSTSVNFTQRLLSIMCRGVFRNDQNRKEVEVLTMKDFLKVFKFNPFAKKAC